MEGERQKLYIKIYKCKRVTKLQFFMSQSMSDPADVLQGVAFYIYLTCLLFVFSWLGDELSTEVSTFEHLNFSFIFIVLVQPSKSYIFALMLVWSPKIIPMLLFTFFDVHFSLFHYNQTAYFNYQTKLQTVYFEGAECSSDFICLVLCSQTHACLSVST